MKYENHGASPAEVRSHLPDTAYKYSVAIGGTIFLIVFSMYLTVWLASLNAQAIWLKAILGIMSGQAIGILFVIGHDAAHGSLTDRPLLNRTLAILAFLPSLHPVCTWEIEHNKLHHGWTNLKGMDPVYPPMSPEEFERLSPFAKRVHKFYRSVWGFGCYYLFDIWLKVLILRRSDHSKDVPLKLLVIDFSAVALFFALQVFACFAFAQTASDVLLNFALSVCVPFLVWNYVMTFVTIQNHTHPLIKWYDNRAEWSYFRAQVEGSIHTVLPPFFDFGFARVFQHTAHHVDKKIPLYRLVKSQAAIADAYKDSVKTIKFTFTEFSSVLNQCQLYDYRNHKWMPFPAATTAAAPYPMSVKAKE